MPIRPSHEERLHAVRWRDAHDREMSLVLALERAGYSRNESRRVAENHRAGIPLAIGANRGPALDD
jgi:hypothetical protein